MSGAQIGYSHAIFGGKNSAYLLTSALNVDKNNNGLIDVYTDNEGNQVNEIELFKADIKAKYNVDFDFSGIKQCEKKQISVFDNSGNTYKYYSHSEVCEDYKSSLCKTLNALNPGSWYADDDVKEYYKKNGVTIAYMSEEDYKRSVALVSKQQKRISDKPTISNRNAQKIADQINKKFNNVYNATIIETSDINGEASVTIEIKRATKLGLVSTELNIDKGAIISNNPDLKSQMNIGFIDRKLMNIGLKEKNYNELEVAAGTTITIPLSKIHSIQ